MPDVLMLGPDLRLVYGEANGGSGCRCGPPSVLIGLTGAPAPDLAQLSLGSVCGGGMSMLLGFLEGAGEPDGSCARPRVRMGGNLNDDWGNGWC